ncbi:uncharacterized protein BCR38DRAFT_519454, partial [Pseudomassariella vexata]
MNPRKRLHTESDELVLLNYRRKISRITPYAIPAEEGRYVAEGNVPHASTAIEQGRSVPGSDTARRRASPRTHAVINIHVQLERLEQTMLKIQDSLHELHLRKSIGSLDESLGSQSVTNSDIEALLLDAQAATSNGLGVCRRSLCNVAGCQIYAGPTLLHCLILDAKEFILESIVNEGTLKQHDAATAKNRLGQLLTTQHDVSEEAGGKDGLPPTMPPTAMLDVIFEPYFDQINPSFPIWTRQGLRAQIDSHRANDVACAISANNMIILTLVAKFVRAISRRPLESSANEQTFSSMEAELARPFVTNARRATKSMDRLLAPKLVNIPALLSMCLIAQYYLSEDIMY